jgi:hypothetical protein
MLAAYVAADAATGTRIALWHSTRLRLLVSLQTAVPALELEFHAREIAMRLPALPVHRAQPTGVNGSITVEAGHQLLVTVSSSFRPDSFSS